MKKLALAMLTAASFLACSALAADYSSLTGEQLYHRFCAACHGLEAAGDGPVADSFRIEVPDLRFISRRNQGQFPGRRIEEIIDGRTMIPAHGSRVMPVWGYEFWTQAGSDSQAEYQTRSMLKRLVGYLRSIQRPAT